MTFIDYNIFQNHFLTIFPEIFFIIAITIILLFGVIYSPIKEYKFPIITRTIGWLSIQTIAIVLLLIGNQSIPGSTCVIFNNVLILDEFTTIVKSIVLISALFTILISFNYIKGQKLNSFEYIILILIGTLSMLFLISSYDLISLYLAIELQSLSFYVLAAFKRNDEFSTEAGLKYFILGALSSGFLLFGESILYGFTGITNFEELSKVFAFNSIQEDILNPNCANISTASDSIVSSDSLSFLSTSNAILIGLLFMLVAFLFKLGAAPFHMWTPDVYQGAPTCVTAFFAITPKIAILALLLRLCLYTFYDLIESWQLIIVICSILSMYIGTFGAINQNKIKRLFAYSSVAHVGYMLIGLSTGTIEAIESLLLYVIIYIVTILNVFGVLLIMSKEDSTIFSPLQRPSKSTFIKSSSMETKDIICPGKGDIPSSNKFFIQTSSSYWNNYYKFKVLTDSLKEGPFKSNDFAEENYLKTFLLRSSNPLWDQYNHASLYSTVNKSFTQKKGSSTLTSYQEHLGGVSGGKDGYKYKYNKKDLISSYENPRVNSLTRFKKKDSYVKYITDLSSLSKTNPLLASTLAIVFFSNAGVPPLAGFYGKLNVFLAALEGSMYFLAFAAIICSVIGAFYSIRLIKIIYYHNISTSWLKWTHYKPINKENAFVLAITFFFTLFFFLYPSFLWTITHNAALALCL